MKIMIRPNFSLKELSCSCCDEMPWSTEALDALQALRTKFGHPMPINSSYRCAHHPIEHAKMEPGPHSMPENDNIAVDVGIAGRFALTLIQAAPEFGFHGVGVSQKGRWADRFIHLDRLWGSNERPRPWIWSY